MAYSQSTLTQPQEDISSSSTFLPWLTTENISLALTTYQTHRLFLIGVQPDGRPSCFKRVFDHAMGLYPTANGLFMGTKDKIWQFENLLGSTETCQGYDCLYVPQQIHELGDLDIHDLVVDAQGQIIFVNTQYNCLATPDPSTGSFRTLWQPPFISKLVPEDRCHLNGLALVAGQPRYVTAVSRSDVIDGWRQKRDSSGIVMDITRNEILTTGLSMPHSPRYYQDKLWLLNSGQGEFGYIDPNNGQFEAITFCPGYGRGLAFWKDYAIVALSRPRDQTFAGLSLDRRLAEKEADPRCGLVVIDLNTGHIVHWMWIDGIINELYDVQVLPNIQCPAVLSQRPEPGQDLRLLLKTRANSNSIKDRQDTKLPAFADTSQVSLEHLEAAKRHFLAGKQAQKAGNDQEAEAAFQAAIALYPGYAAAHHQLGLVWVQQDRFPEAKPQFEQVLRLNPNSVAAHTNLAQILVQVNDIERAMAHFRTALQLDRNYIPALFNFGLLYRQLYELDQATILFKRIIALDPQHHEAILQLGQIWDYQGKFVASQDLYKQSLKYTPDQESICQRLGMVKVRLCDWQNYDEFVQQVITAATCYVAGQKDSLALGAYDLNLLPLPLDLMAATLRRYGQSIAESVAPLRARCSWQAPPDSGKLRIGYASPDFADHAVGRLIDQLFQHHSREHFEIYGYALRPLDSDDPYSQLIRKGCDTFRDLANLPLEEAAQRINQDGIHILVNLAGYTAFGRPELFALQSAPVQIQWLGFPNTMGADFIQYLLADSWLVPPASYPYYYESVINLPHAFVGSPTALPASVPDRTSQGLPAKGFVFGCFNTHHKIDPDVFATWMRILHNVPNSVLWLAEPRVEVIAHNLQQAAQNHGIEPSRLIFARKLPYPEHLARLALVDLTLDTFIYTAGSTAIASVAAGVPLLTKAGASNASRMGASICASVGLESLICETTAAYEQQAITLATHLDQLSAIKQKLQAQRWGNVALGESPLPLFDLHTFAHHLEQAYQHIWQKRVIIGLR
ncbi:TIGR03032 family protein [Synechocystis sp. LKSZ1]|uniref:TIGR03032 family protein n=1 Tax=Synechocystis sp. LKSZ1 TaxID=3144951 RepID=UPI00336BD1EE